ncbi:MAG: stage II sporulation protein M [Desulfosarcina sp.]|nr:stage II sporulation protein M [Desulfosarcina sp.]
MKTNQPLLYIAWKKLIVAYVIALATGLVAGTLLVKIGHIQPERIFEVSTKRLSYALPVLDMGSRHGIDSGILLFVWNSIGALITMSFIYTAALFDSRHIGLPPRVVRKIFGGKTRMKILCYLPGCSKIEEESLRRVYVWVMVPLLGIILLGIESGLQVSTATYIFGSFFSAIMALLPHGLIEIPTLALAGAVAYSAHPLVSALAPGNTTRAVFQQIEKHRNAMPIMKIAILVIGCLFVAGWVEGHVTPMILDNLFHTHAASVGMKNFITPA